MEAAVMGGLCTIVNLRLAETASGRADKDACAGRLLSIERTRDHHVRPFICHESQHYSHMDWRDAFFRTNDK